MESNRSQFVLKALPSLADLAFLMPIVFLFGRMDGVKTLLGDCDTGWHIRTGEWIIANGWIPSRDMFSFTKPGGQWFAWEWLWDVVFAWLNARGGLAAVVLVSIVLISITFAMLFRLVRRSCNPVVAIAVTFVAAAASSIHWLARPHLFTLLFAVVFYGLLERVRSGNSKRLGGVPVLAVLPVLTVLWTNLHGGFFVGIALVCGYAGGALAKTALAADAEGRRSGWFEAKRYLACAAACLGASFLNPYFYHLHVHIFKYLGDPFQSQHINEFLSLSFRHPIAIFFEIFLLLGSFAAYRGVRRGEYIGPALLLVWAHAGLLSVRNIPIFMIVAAPWVGSTLQEWLSESADLPVAGWARRVLAKFNGVAAEVAEIDDAPRWRLASVAGVALLAALLYAPAPPQAMRAEFDPKVYPAMALNAMKPTADSRIFTGDEWGDYLIYRLYPRTKVFVDGRSDFYGADFEEKYVAALNVQHGWEQTLGRYGVDTILLPPSAPLAGALKESSRWRVAYDDGVALVFKPAPHAGGEEVSTAQTGGGKGRDREVTKTQAGDPTITLTKPKT